MSVYHIPCGSVACPVCNPDGWNDHAGSPMDAEVEAAFASPPTPDEMRRARRVAEFMDAPDASRLAGPDALVVGFCPHCADPVGITLTCARCGWREIQI